MVAVSEYADSTLRQLRSPAGDATEFGQVLGSPDLGGFDVTTVLDERAHEIRLAVEDFLNELRPDDLAVVYLSCHGLVDARRRLYFAASDTVKERLASTGVEARWLLDQLEECRARRQAVILDCCFSGAFASNTKGDNNVQLGDQLMGEGRGRVVLTASRATEYSFEGTPTAASAVPGSVFTAALATGIRTGAADADDDGYISVDDAYAYAFDEMRAAGAQQTPQRWLYGAEGDIVLAKNPTATGTKLTGTIPTRRPGSVPAAAPGHLIGAQPRPGASWRPPRWWRGDRVWFLAVVGALVVAAVATGVIAALNRSGGEEFSFTNGTDVEASNPWHLTISPGVDVPADGCRVSVHRDSPSGAQVADSRWSTTENNVVLQVTATGSFYLDYPDGCEVNAEPGQGETSLPVTIDTGVGDSYAWNPTGTIELSAPEDSAFDCRVHMINGENGAPMKVITLTQAEPTATWESPGTTSSVFMRLAATTCRVTADRG